MKKAQYNTSLRANNMKNIKIVTPVSHLFKNDGNRKMIIENSDLLELRDSSILLDSNNIKLYHSDYNLVTLFDKNTLKRFEEFKVRYNFDAISFHLSSKYKKNKIINNSFVGIGKPLTETEMKSNIKKNIQTLRKIFDDIPIMVENNNHLKSDAYDIITEPRFISKIVNENNIYFLFDIPHALISKINTNQENYISKLPLKRTLQIHISKHGFKKGEIIDAHEELKEEDWNFLKETISKTFKLKYITIEYYKNGTKLIEQLKRLNQIIKN
ncbi:hypothetical protein CEE44_02200 [Candidatus Woesearchaeota archaeon B3_Woes]|nr:MAG: hypothetical protein CEE44_02200 [Candidatus Woesearchaeota archaeon B3_Woes]